MLYVLLAICGIFSGIVGGMGMGGGTILIPLLTIAFGFNQKVAQGVNLLAFSFMAVIVLIIHIKNKLVDIKIALLFSLLSVLFSVGGALLANVIKTQWLKIAFGILLMFVAIYQTICEIRNQQKK